MTCQLVGSVAVTSVAVNHICSLRIEEITERSASLLWLLSRLYVRKAFVRDGGIDWAFVYKPPARAK